MSFSILIPFHNDKRLLSKCLEAVCKTTPDNVGILIVCNNENPEEIDLKIENPRIAILKYDYSIPYPEAVNIGMKHLYSDGVFILDADVICTGDWFNQMTALFESSSDIGIIGANILNPDDGTISDFGLCFDDYSWVHPHKDRHHDFPLVHTREFQSICSACCLVHRDTFIALDGYDERLPYSYCDIDLCLRIRERGKKVIGCAFALVYHFGSSHLNNNAGLRADSKAKLSQLNAARLTCAINPFFKENYEYFKTGKKICKKYIFIDLSTVSNPKIFSERVKELLGIELIGKYSFRNRDRDAKHINLSLKLPADLYATPLPIIYFTDVFRSLGKNKLWNKLRDCSDDIVIDRHANIELLLNID